MKTYKADYRASEYNGKWIYITPSGGTAAVKADETAFASLGQQKLVLGDLNAVKSVIDIHSGAAKGGVSFAMIAALNETRESALVRFIINFLEIWRREILKQDGFFKSIASIKMILGALDTADDSSLSLGAILRTASQNEASDLESDLKALVSLVGGYPSDDPKLEIFGQMLDPVKIGSERNDVSLAVTAPLSGWRWETGQATSRRESGTRNRGSASPGFRFNTRFTSGKSALAIPFELEGNVIYLQVRVNDSPPLSFLLDTGSSLHILSLRNATSFGMKLRPPGKGIGGVGVGPPDFYIVTDKVSFSLPGVALSNQNLLAMPLDKCDDKSTADGSDQSINVDQKGEKKTGRVIDGVLGREFFSNFVVEIDYDARLIDLHDPRSYHYTGREKSLSLEKACGMIFFRHTPAPNGERYGGLLGAPALRNFKVILDYSRSRMILESLSPVTGASPIKIERQQNSPQKTDAVTEDLENLKRFVGVWKEDPPPDPDHDVAQAVIFKIEEGKLIGMQRQLSVRYANGEFFRDRDEFTPTGELKVKGKTVSWRTGRLKYFGEGADIQTRVTLMSDNEAVMDYIGEIAEGDRPLMLAPYRLTLKKQPDLPGR